MTMKTIRIPLYAYDKEELGKVLHPLGKTRIGEFEKTIELSRHNNIKVIIQGKVHTDRTVTMYGLHTKLPMVEDDVLLSAYKSAAATHPNDIFSFSTEFLSAIPMDEPNDRYRLAQAELCASGQFIWLVVLVKNDNRLIKLQSEMAASLKKLGFIVEDPALERLKQAQSMLEDRIGEIKAQCEWNSFEQIQQNSNQVLPYTDTSRLTTLSQSLENASTSSTNVCSNIGTYVHDGSSGYNPYTYVTNTSGSSDWHEYRPSQTTGSIISEPFAEYYDCFQMLKDIDKQRAELKDKKETSMNIFGNVKMGKAGNDFSISMYGTIAYRGKTYINGQVYDTQGMNIPFDMLYLVPATEVEAGDVILKEDAAYYVVEATKDNVLTVVNLENSKQETLLPGGPFGMNIYSKVFNPMGDMSKNKDGNAFGNMLMMQSLMGNGNRNSGDNGMLMAMMMMQGGFKFPTLNFGKMKSTEDKDAEDNEEK